MRKWWEAQPLSRKFTVVMLVFVIIPIIAIGMIIISWQRQNTENESVSYLGHAMERTRDSIVTSIDSVNMATQFFLNDESLKDILEAAADGKKPSTDTLLDFYETDVASLERLVNSNPLLYAVRAYAVTDDVQEMMPVLYAQSRMQQQPWAEAGVENGWYFSYTDQLFAGRIGSQNTYLAAYISPVKSYGNRTIGVVETVISMENMFPTLYDDVENEYSFFLAEDGSIYGGQTDNDRTESAGGDMSQADSGTVDTSAYETFAAGQIDRITEELEKADGTDTTVTAYAVTSGSGGMVVAAAYLKELGGTLICVQDISEKYGRLQSAQLIYLGVMLALAVILAFAINGIVERLLRKLYEILQFITSVQEGDMESRITDCGEDEMGILGSQINAMLDHIEHLNQDNLNREMLIKNSEIRALQNQINTHFIYNVLESIKMMAEIDEEYAISDAVTSLGHLMRYSIRWSSDNVRMEQELAYIRNYVALMNLRYDYEIHLVISIPTEMLRQRIPKMSLQPIIENAIKHGVEDLAEETTIYIKGKRDGDRCLIEISDQGKGMTPDQLEQLEQKLAGQLEADSGSGHGIGLKNVQDRIHIAFGRDYGLSFASMPGCYTKVTMTIPYEKAEDGEGAERLRETHERTQ